MKALNTKNEKNTTTNVVTNNISKRTNWNNRRRYSL